MPITPFHFGPGALLHAVAPKQVSFLAFCAANVIIDFESLYNLVNQRHPVHAFFHTYLGASLIIAAVLLLFVSCRWAARKLGHADRPHWHSLTSRQVLVGAALGAYSHVILDSVMHQDIRPLSPFNPDNPMLGIIPLGVLHMGCVALGLLGLLIVAVRWFVARSQDGR